MIFQCEFIDDNLVFQCQKAGHACKRCKRKSVYNYYYGPTENMNIRNSKILQEWQRTKRRNHNHPSSRSKPHLTGSGIAFCLHYILALWSSTHGSRMPLCQSTSGDVYGVKPNSGGWRDVSDSIRAIVSHP